MARPPRLDLPGICQHLVQRGNDRQACFRTSVDRRFYLEELQDCARRADCQIHAYVLMDNHAHLLATPQRAGAVSRMMQALGRRYVAWFNARHERSGTLWEGRFKSALVEDDRYVLNCYRYIELNPVRAGLVARPGDFRWSSHAGNARGWPDPLITPHPSYLALGEAETRWRNYGVLFDAGSPPREVEAIRAHTRQQRAWGGEHFQSQVAALSGRPAQLRARGGSRPGHRRRGPGEVAHGHEST